MVVVCSVSVNVCGSVYSMFWVSLSAGFVVAVGACVAVV